jgi:hypothetical protein
MEQLEPGGSVSLRTAAPSPATPQQESRSSSRRYRKQSSKAGLGVFTPPLLVRGFIAGLLAALTFRQGALFLLSLADLVPPPSFRLKPVPPLAIPPVALLALWGGLWGAALALVLPRRTLGKRYWLTSRLVGAVLPAAASLAGVLVTEQLSVDALPWMELVGTFVVEAAWALGTALLLALL